MKKDRRSDGAKVLVRWAGLWERHTQGRTEGPEVSLALTEVRGCVFGLGTCVQTQGGDGLKAGGASAVTSWGIGARWTGSSDYAMGNKMVLKVFE